MIENIVEIENFIPKSFQNLMEDLCLSDSFDWYYKKDVTKADYKSHEVNDGFCHSLYADQEYSTHYPQFYPLIFFLEDRLKLTVKDILRFRLGLLLNNNSTGQYNTPHIDFPFSHCTAIYYVNDCDGDTVIFQETEQSEQYSIQRRVTPKKGKMAVFNGAHYHSSSKPYHSTARCVLTINFTVS